MSFRVPFGDPKREVQAVHLRARIAARDLGQANRDWLGDQGGVREDRALPSLEYCTFGRQVAASTRLVILGEGNQRAKKALFGLESLNQGDTVAAAPTSSPAFT
jgi:hypothetical protein